MQPSGEICCAKNSCAYGYDQAVRTHKEFYHEFQIGRSLKHESLLDYKYLMYKKSKSSETNYEFNLIIELIDDENLHEYL